MSVSYTYGTIQYRVVEVLLLNKAQLLKGLLEGCILKIISQEETYGYVITEALNEYGFKDLNEGSIYPVLIRLEKKGYVTSESRKSELGPRRKYYKISPKGRDELESFGRLWEDISVTVNRILKGGVIHE